MDLIAYGYVLRERTDIWIGLTLAFIGGGVYNSRSAQLTPLAKSSKKLQHLTQAFLAAVASFALITAAFKHYAKAEPVPYNPQERVATAGIWTLHFGLDNRLHDSQRRISELLDDVELDILGILESDLNHIVTGNRDMVQRIAEEKGYYVDLGPAPQKRMYFCFHSFRHTRKC